MAKLKGKKRGGGTPARAAAPSNGGKKGGKPAKKGGGMQVQDFYEVEEAMAEEENKANKRYDVRKDLPAPDLLAHGAIDAGAVQPTCNCSRRLEFRSCDAPFPATTCSHPFVPPRHLAWRL